SGESSPSPCDAGAAEARMEISTTKAQRITTRITAEMTTGIARPRGGIDAPCDHRSFFEMRANRFARNGPAYAVVKKKSASRFIGTFFSLQPSDACSYLCSYPCGYSSNLGRRSLHVGECLPMRIDHGVRSCNRFLIRSSSALVLSN